MTGKRSEEAFKTGIFVQQDNDPLTSRTKGYCVTFPRIDSGGSEALFPSDTFSTFGAALMFARHIRNVDSRLRNCAIWCRQFSWRRGYMGKPIMTLVEEA